MCWQPVALDCNGIPEPAPVTYQHEMALLPPQGFVACVLDGQPGMCATPAPLPRWVSAPDVDGGCAETSEPRVGEIVMLRTTAVDEAGNLDCGL